MEFIHDVISPICFSAGLPVAGIGLTGGSIPANALLNEDGNPIINEDGSYILTTD